MALASLARCRVCASSRVSAAGCLEHGGKRFEVLDCGECGCRFTAHDVAPGTTIRVSGRETNATTNGAFQIQVTAGAARELTVEARDSQGNSSQYKVSLSRGRT